MSSLNVIQPKKPKEWWTSLYRNYVKRIKYLQQRLIDWKVYTQALLDFMVCRKSTKQTFIPLGPIVSLYRVTNVRIVKRIGIHFIEISINKHHVKNSEEFVKSVTSVKIEETEILVSFDVISLFSKIPVDLAIKVAQERLYKLQNLNELTKWSVNDICNGLQICLEATYLTFRKINFKQIFGTAMGCQVSVVVANLVMEDVETRAFETFAHPPPPPPPPPRLWLRYVDDTFVIIEKKILDIFFDHINHLELSIKFTMETENDT